MGQRSRKRGRRGPAGAGAASTATPERPPTRAADTPAADAPAARAGAADAPAGRRPRMTSEERNAAVRATLTPFAAGERPAAIKIGVAVAFGLGLANLILFLAGVKPHVGGSRPHLFEILVFSGLMIMCAVGMWLMRYWAVLGFQTLLAIGVLGFALALVKASTILGAAICVVVIGGGGYLFFKLVRVLSRLQMPTPPGRS